MANDFGSKVMIQGRERLRMSDVGETPMFRMYLANLTRLDPFQRQLAWSPRPI
jgi:hypothetical protein